MKPIDWPEIRQRLTLLPAGQQEYWGAALTRLEDLQSLDPDYVQQRLNEFQAGLDQLPSPQTSPSELAGQVMAAALEQLRKVLRGAEYDRLQTDNLDMAANRKAIWEKLAALNKDPLPPLPPAPELRSLSGSWTGLDESDWRRLRKIQGALAYIQVRDLEMVRPLRLALARVLEKTGPSLKKEIQTLETRCQRELEMGELQELEQILSTAGQDA